MRHSPVVLKSLSTFRLLSNHLFLNLQLCISRQSRCDIVNYLVSALGRWQASSRATDTSNKLNYLVTNFDILPATRISYNYISDVEGYRLRLKQSILIPDALILVRRISVFIGKVLILEGSSILVFHHCQCFHLIFVSPRQLNQWRLYQLNGDPASNIHLEIGSPSKSQALLGLPRLNVCKPVCRHFPGLWCAYWPPSSFRRYQLFRQTGERLLTNLDTCIP